MDTEIPNQPKVDASEILKEIIAADDGREPMEKARHNLVDPTPGEVMDFVGAQIDEYDAKIELLKDVLKWVLLNPNMSIYKRYELAEALYERNSGRKNSA